MQFKRRVTLNRIILATGATLLLAAGLFAALFTAAPNLSDLYPGTRPDLDGRVADAIEKALVPHYTSGEPFDPSKRAELARAIASKIENYPAEYNRPEKLMLGDSAAVQLAIKTNKQQDIEPYFKGFEGEVTAATVLVANEVSAQLSGPPDRLEIKLRGDEKMRTISSPVPITWVWDVKPLKPGKAQVTLEITSYIKTGQNKEPVPIRVLQDTWYVDARGLEWAKYQIEEIEPIRAFIFSIFAAVVSVLAWFGFRGWGKAHGGHET